MHPTTLIPAVILLLSIVVITLLCIEHKAGKRDHTPLDKAGKELELTKKIK